MLHQVLLETDNYYKMFIYATIVTFLGIGTIRCLTNTVLPTQLRNWVTLLTDVWIQVWRRKQPIILLVGLHHPQHIKVVGKLQQQEK